MDPYYIGLILGLFLGCAGGIFVLALVSHGRNSDLERDADRFRALNEAATPVINEDGMSATLEDTADGLIAEMRRNERSASGALA